MRRISRAGEVETLRPVLFVAGDTATDDGPVLRQPRGVAANQSHLYIGVIISATSHWHGCSCMHACINPYSHLHTRTLCPCPARTRTRTPTPTRAADSKMHRIVAVELAASCNGAQAGRTLPSRVIAGQGHRSLSLYTRTPSPLVHPSHSLSTHACP